MKAIMYGAGNIGRGFIGQIFAQSGYELCFIDVAEQIIEALNHDGRYPVRILSGDSVEDQWIEDVSAINGKNAEEVAHAIEEADIMATAVGVRVLPLIAPLVAGGLKKRFARTGFKPLNIIICENLIDANKVLEGLIKDHLSADERRIFDDCVGLVEASIGRMVPIQTAEMQDGNLLRVCVEAYGFLPVDKAAFKGEIPALAGMCPFDHFDFYIKRKLFVHNLGHAICAYLGMICGDTYIYETVRRGGIQCIAQNAMLESALALSAKFGMPLSDLHYHIRDLLRRFSNKALGDTCARVGGDMARKLGKQDRLIGSLIQCTEEGVNPVFVSIGCAAALYCYLKETGAPQGREAALAILREVSSLEKDSPLATSVLSFYSIVASGTPGRSFDGLIEDLIREAMQAGRQQRII